MSTLSKIPAGVIEPVRRKSAEVVNATGDAVTHTYGATTWPDHNNLRCVDFMVGSIAAGDRVAGYLIAHAQRLGVLGIIWNGRVMGFPTGPRPPYRGPSGVWRPYSGPNPHRDHPHVEFNAAPYRPPAPDVAMPAPKPTPPVQEDDDMALSNEDKQWLETMVETKSELAVQRALWTDVLDDRDEQSWRNWAHVLGIRVHAIAKHLGLTS